MKNNVTRIDFFKAAIGMLIVLAFAGSLLLQSAGLTAYAEVKAGEEAASIADGKNLDDKNIIPEEWFDMPYDEFLKNLVTLAAAAHYGFTPGELKRKKGLKKFFGFNSTRQGK